MRRFIDHLHALPAVPRGAVDLIEPLVEHNDEVADAHGTRCHIGPVDLIEVLGGLHALQSRLGSLHIPTQTHQVGHAGGVLQELEKLVREVDRHGNGVVTSGAERV